MSVQLFAKRSIFFRIYAGLLLVCLATAFFSYLFVSIINTVRFKSYQEEIFFGVFYLISEQLKRQDAAGREQWLQDIGGLFGDTLELRPESALKFSAKERNTLDNRRIVVRSSGIQNQFMVYQKIFGTDEILMLKITQIGDRQARAMASLILSELDNYSTDSAKQARLDELSQKFGYPITLKNIQSLQLDKNQILSIHWGETVVALVDGASHNQSSTMLVVAPTKTKDTVILIGPVLLFRWLPPSLLMSAVLIAMLLIGLGLYALIYPLERRLRLLQAGVSEVAKGKLDTRVQVVGRDDVAQLSSTFNAMTTHIRRLIESQRELTRAVSHELRTPVARIRFAVDMLADEDDYDSRQSQKQYIDDDIHALDELIDEILTYAKLEESVPQMDWQMVNLRELIEQVVKETKALGKPIEINYNLPDAKTLVMADRRYLHRVLQNFATNALRYAKTTIIISGWVDKDKAFVGVEDDGQGINEADREKVFVPFARLDDSRTRTSGGYGLGLSIVSRIAFWFDGQAKVDKSPVLGGAKFTMSFPVQQMGMNPILLMTKTQK